MRRSARRRARFCALQRDDGHFVFELEADATIPAEYVLMRHYRGEPVDAALEEKIARYLRRIQSADGGWPLFHAGRSDISASVKAYFALKMIGDRGRCAAYGARPRLDPRPRRRRQQQRVHAQPACALWRDPLARRAGDAGRDHAPAALVSLPSRQGVLLGAHGARAADGAECAEAARGQRQGRAASTSCSSRRRRDVRHWPKGAHQKSPWSEIFGGIDRVLHATQPYFPRATRKRAIERAVAFVTERLNGEDGLGAIFPAMVNALLMFDALGLPRRRPEGAQSRASRDRETAGDQGGRGLLPALPVAGLGYGARGACAARSRRRGVRTADACRASNGSARFRCSTRSAIGLSTRPSIRPGGWAFQYANPHYPDLDDTAVVVMAMDRSAARIPEQQPRDAFSHAIDRAQEWVVGMQSENGGWAAFDADNEYYYLNQIPFADHGASARSADRRRHGALRLDARSAWRKRGQERTRSTRGSPICCARRRRTAAGTAAGA